MRKMRIKRIASLLVALCMMVALLPSLPVFAKDLRTYTYNFSYKALGLTENISHSNQIAATIGADGSFGNYYSSENAYADSNKWVFVGRRSSYSGFTREGYMDVTLGSAGILPGEGTGQQAFVLKINVPEGGTFSPSISFNKVALGATLDFYIVDTDTEGFEAKKIASVTGGNGNIPGVLNLLKSAGDKYHLGSVDTYTNSTDANPATLKTVTLEAGDYWLICELSGLNSALTDAARYTVQLKNFVLNEASAEITLDISDDKLTVGDTATLSSIVKNVLGAIVKPDITYTYDDKVIAVDKDGKVTAVGAGNTQIKATAIVDGVEINDVVSVSVAPKIDGSEEVTLEYLFGTSVLRDETLNGTTMGLSASGGLQGTITSFDQLNSTTQPWLLKNQYKAAASNITASRLLFAATQANIKAGNAWMVFKIQIPKGTYKFEANVADYIYGAGIDVYLFPSNGINNAGAAEFNKLTPVGHFETYSETGNGNSFKNKTVANAVTIDKEDDYFVVFKLTDGGYFNATNNREMIYLAKFIFSSLRPEMTLSVSADELEVGDTATVSTAVKNAAGETVTPDVTYTYDENVVSIENGTVTAKSVGETEIKATVTVDGIEISDTVSIKVVEKDIGNAGANLEYVFKSTVFSEEMIAEATVDEANKFSGYYGGVLRNVEFIREYSAIDENYPQWKLAPMSYTTFNVASNQINLNIKPANYGKSLPTSALIFTLKVPNKGNYKLALNANASSFGTGADVYFINAAEYPELNREDIDKMSPVGYYDTKGSGETGYVELGTVTANKRGDYYLVLDFNTENKETNNKGDQYLYLLGAKLYEAVPTLDVSVDAELVEVGEEYPIITVTKDSLGKVIDGVEVEYSVDKPGVVSIENGKIKGVSAGNVKITASVKGGIDGHSVTAEVDVEVFDFTQPIPTLNYIFSYKMITAAKERISFSRYIDYAKYGEYPESLNLEETAPWSVVGTRGSYSGYIDASYFNFSIDEAQLDADAKLYEQGLPGTINQGFVMKINVPNTGLYTPKLSYSESPYGMRIEMYIFPTNLTGTLSAEKLTAVGTNNSSAANIGSASKMLTPESEFYAGTVRTSPTEHMPVYKNVVLREGDYFVFFKPVAGSDAMLGTSGKYQVYIESLTLTKVSTNIVLGGAKSVGIGDTATITAEVRDIKGNLIPDAVVTFESSDKNVVTVDAETGVVTGISEGEADIIAKTEIEGETFKSEVTIDVYKVQFERVEAENLEIEYSAEDKTAQIQTKAFLTNGEEILLDDILVEYKSKTPDIVSVDENGVVTALSAGKGIVEVTGVVGNIGKRCEVEVVVTDNSEITSVEVIGENTVAYLRDTKLALRVSYADGRNIDVSAPVEDSYPGANIEWKTYESSSVGAVTIDENGVVFGEIPGATAKIGAVITVGEQTVETLEGFEITVEASEDNDPRSFGYDLYATLASGAKFVELEVDGWKPDISASASAARFQINSSGLSIQTNAPNQKIYIDVKVPYSGLYDFSISGRAQGARGAERFGIFVDGRYVGEYSCYKNSLTRDLAPKSLSAIYLDAGVHRIMTVTYPNEGFSEYYSQVLRTLYFMAEQQNFGMKDIIVEDEAFCLSVGDVVNPYARMETDAGFAYAWEESDDKLLDVSYAVSASTADDGSDASVISVDEKGNITALAYGTAEVLIKAERKDKSESFEKTVYVTVAGVIGSLENARSTFYTDESVDMVLNYSKADGSAVTTAPTVEWASSASNVVSFDGATLNAKNEGTAVITAKDKSNGKTLYENTVEVVADYYGIVKISADPSLTLRPERTAELFAKATTMAGKELDMNGAVVEWSVSDEYADIILVTEAGMLTAISEGTAFVTATVILSDGREAAGVAEVSVREGKTSRTYYTDEKVQAARENAQKYDWAKAEVKAAVKEAEKYLELTMEDAWNLIPGEGIPRSWYVGVKGDPDRMSCRYCNADLKLANGSYPWITDPLKDPWKIQCPECKRRFPSNDFASFYKLGLDPETGVFSRDLALEKHLEMFGGTYGYGYLKNDLYPELRDTGIDPRTKKTITHGWGKLPKEPENIADVWGVDDGYGYETGRMATDSIREAHTYISFYNHFGLWYQSGAHNAAVNYLGIRNLATAYVYTGEEKYGKLAAVMLDRLADVYPDYKASKAIALGAEFGSTSYGKILNNIWEAQIGKYYMYAYDAVFPMYENEEVQRFLQKKAEQYPGIADKSSANAIRDNIENNYIYEMYESALEREVRGNFGFVQSTIGAAAVVLDRQPDSTEMLDWVFATGVLTDSSATGADIGTTLVDQVSRDGQGTESPAYNRIWLQDLSQLANVLSDYENNNGYSLWDHPKYIQMARVYNQLTLIHRGIPSIGDSGTAGSFGEFPDDGVTIQNAFKYTKDNEETKQASIEIAQRIYHLQTLYGNNLDALHYDIFTPNPESIQDDVLEIIREYGEYDYDKSSITTGYGLAALRGGALYDTVGSNTIDDTTRDFWMYFGGQNSHSHNDMLNIGVEAYGLNLAPENGYPEGTSATPSRGQWTNTTIAHNTVTVDEKPSFKPAKAGDPLHFDAKDTRVKVMDVDVPEVYEETKEYRRTIVMIDYDSDISYGVDFFKVLGGDDHLYSFHAASEVIGSYSDNIKLYHQPTGSYAGVDVPFGDDPWTDNSNNYARMKYPLGYTWLFDVRRADNPDIAENEPFYADFDIIDFNKHSRNTAKMDINLRLTMVNDFVPDEISFAKGYPPRTEKNLANIDYYEHMLVRRKGNNLNTLFATVIEPYNGKRYIENISRVEMIPEGDTGTDKYAAVKVELCDGRVDYVMYAQNNDVTYTVRDGDYEFSFRGFVGVWTVDAEKNNLYSYISDGDTIGDVSGAVPSVSGTITGFTEELAFDNYIDVEFENAVSDAELLEDRIIIAEYTGNGNATYFIEDVELAEDGMSARLGIGGVTPISGYLDKHNMDLGYAYDIAKGTRFEIPLSYENDGSPVFDALSGQISASAGSSVSVKVNATATEEGGKITYSERTLPRGASFDTESGVLTWKPSASQTGENLVGIDATDEKGRTSTLYFTIMVYGSTTGSGSQTQTTPSTPSEPSIPSTPSTPSTPGSSGGGAGGGGGGGSAPAPSTPSDDKTDETPSVGDADSSLGEGAEKVRFVDLGAHAWAADAINALADEGIIKGTSEDTFSPAANITRADFALLLVRAFKLESENTENFADVNASDYFAPELAIARNTGIVNGIGDNKYAPRNTITRQDMMTIVYRAMEQINKKPSPVGEGGPLNTDEAFADIASVSEYAKDAVTALNSA
ncbi:MAG: S-layer homology domain-containing protein [Oscillospiraceae bacterium]|nr:S-layer homology domain-containing protein [Oscillospiraceae bacterium]